MKIVESNEIYDEFLGEIHNKRVIILPTFTYPEKHYCNNELSLLYVRVLDNSQEYVIGFNHTELTSLSTSLLDRLSPEIIYTTNQKQLLRFIKNNNIKDVGIISYLRNNNEPAWILDTQTHLYFNRKYSSTREINTIIPIQ